MLLTDFIRAMPKVELHVHLEGSIQPETLLKLAGKNGISLPANTIEGLRQWYQFTDFDHFIQVYLKICECICSPDDIELLAREFLAGQAAQNIVYSEVTYTAYTHYEQKGLPFAEQLDALNRARAWAESTLGVTMRLIIDISRGIPLDAAMNTAEWVIAGYGNGVVALGIGGPEADFAPEIYTAAFDRVRQAGIPSVPHAGELAGPASIWGALRALNAVRIGHGVRCLEDPALVDELRTRQIPLEVCPTSNVCLKVVPDFARHPLPRLIQEGLYVTLNSDDPPMFNTRLTDEYLKAVEAFGFDAEAVERLVMNAANAVLLPTEDKILLRQRIQAQFDDLRQKLLSD